MIAPSKSLSPSGSNTPPSSSSHRGHRCRSAIVVVEYQGKFTHSQSPLPTPTPRSTRAGTRMLGACRVCCTRAAVWRRTFVIFLTRYHLPSTFRQVPSEVAKPSHNSGWADSSGRVAGMTGGSFGSSLTLYLPLLFLSFVARHATRPAGATRRRLSVRRSPQPALSQTLGVHLFPRARISSATRATGGVR